MPQTKLMNWEGNRWSRMSNGTRIYVGPRRLKKEFPELYRSNSESGSLAAANAWWRKHQHEYEQGPTVNGFDFVRAGLMSPHATIEKVPVDLSFIHSDVGQKVRLGRQVISFPVADRRTVEKVLEKAGITYDRVWWMRTDVVPTCLADLAAMDSTKANPKVVQKILEKSGISYDVENRTALDSIHAENEDSSDFSLEKKLAAFLRTCLQIA